MKKVILLAILTTNIAFASKKQKTVAVPNIKADEFAIFDKDHYRTFSTFQVDGLTLDKSCQAKSGKPSCEAYKKALNSPVPNKNGAFIGSPASQLCADFGGNNLIAFNHKKQEYNFCEFPDGSLVNSWSMYDLRNGK